MSDCHDQHALFYKWKIISEVAKLDCYCLEWSIKSVSSVGPGRRQTTCMLCLEYDKLSVFLFHDQPRKRILWIALYYCSTVHKRTVYLSSEKDKKCWGSQVVFFVGIFSLRFNHFSMFTNAKLQNNNTSEKQKRKIQSLLGPRHLVPARLRYLVPTLPLSHRAQTE